jgi:hypothetical protein
MIQRGDADAMLAGGADAVITPVVVGCFGVLRALSTRNDAPGAASRPFDRDRDGFVLAEGAGMLVLEELELARARGAHHPTAPSTDGPARAMLLALADAGVSPGAVDYINAHGTSTPHNDVNETSAIKRAFGDHAGRLAISSTKSMTGHLIGAAGAVEAVATVLAMESVFLSGLLGRGSTSAPAASSRRWAPTSSTTPPSPSPCRCCCAEPPFGDRCGRRLTAVQSTRGARRVPAGPHRRADRSRIQGGTHDMRVPASRLVAVLGTLILLGGCFGAYQVSPDSVQTVGGLTPNVEDTDAGLVGLVRLSAGQAPAK